MLVKRFILSILVVLFASFEAYPDIRLAVLLPFQEQGERATRMVEFYRGILMAVDSVRSQNVNVDVYAYNTTGSISQLQEILSQPDMDRMDFIIGPADQGLCLPLSQFCQQHGIRHIMPFSLPGAGLAGRPRYYQVSAPWRQVQSYAAERLIQYYGNANYVYVNTSMADERGAGFVNTLRQGLQNEKFRSVTYNLSDGESALSDVLSHEHRNVLYLDNTSIKAMDQLFEMLDRWQALSQGFQVEVLGFPEWKNVVSQYLQQYYRWNTTIYTPYYRNPLSSHTAEIDKQYSANFNQEMFATFPRYALMGFDIAYYFLHGYATLGEELESRGSELQYRPYQHPMIFRQTTPEDGLVNSAVLLVNYNKNHNIVVR